MNKIFRTILISLTAIFGVGFLFALPAKAIQDELVVEYSSDGGNSWLPFSAAIFNETNFLPGQDVTRLIRVTNNSESTQRIAVEAVNEINIGDLASQLDIVIKEGSNTIYSKTLKQFFNDGEIYLSSLAGLGSQTQYDFAVSFKSGADNDYQGKSAGFDLLVGFEGTEGGLTLPPPGGSAGGGGYLPPGLTVQNETAATTTATSVTIIWTTSYLSTSQVIYDIESDKFNLSAGPPNYGYASSKEGDDSGSPKVTSHSVTITGLTPVTKYYFRAVSHGSLAISREYSFTTLGVKVEENAEQGIEQNLVPAEEKTPLVFKQTEAPEEVIEEGKETVDQQEIEEPALVKEKPSEKMSTKEGLLAAMGVLPFNLKTMTILLFGVVLGLSGLYFAQRRKKIDKIV